MRVILLLIAFFVAFVASADTLTVKPLWIHDGDTFRATVLNKAVIDCRIWGIDAPELNQPWGKVSKSALIEMIHNKKVEIITKSSSFNRSVVVAKVGDRDIGLELIKMGLAWHEPKYAAKAEEYRKAEEEARAARRGLWQDENPVSPWDHRAKNKN